MHQYAFFSTDVDKFYLSKFNSKCFVKSIVVSMILSVALLLHVWHRVMDVSHTTKFHYCVHSLAHENHMDIENVSPAWLAAHIPRKAKNFYLMDSTFVVTSYMYRHDIVVAGSGCIKKMLNLNFHRKTRFSYVTSRRLTPPPQPPGRGEMNAICYNSQTVKNCISGPQKNMQEHVLGTINSVSLLWICQQYMQPVLYTSCIYTSNCHPLWYRGDLDHLGFDHIWPCTLCRCKTCNHCHVSPEIRLDGQSDLICRWFTDVGSLLDNGHHCPRISGHGRIQKVQRDPPLIYWCRVTLR